MVNRRNLYVPFLVALISFKALCGIPEGEFAQRRGRLVALVDTSAAFVFRAADAKQRSSDVTYPYRQESDFLYLTGISEPNLTLLVVPAGVLVEGQRWTYLLFGATRSSEALTVPGVFQGGIVLDAERFADMLAGVASRVHTLYVSTPDLRFTNDWLNNRPLFLDRDARRDFQQKHPGLKIKNAAIVVARLRGCKSTSEVESISKAIRATGDGIRHAMAVCRAGAMEFELQAAIEYEMTREGARGLGFPSIVGSGPNSVIPHYDVNTRKMESGDVVVMDVGAEYEGYSADVTRTIPVSGKFTKEQREVYSVVLAAQREVIKIIRPGVLWSEVEAKAREVLQNAGFGKYMPHPVSHHLGLDVHDSGPMDTLRTGMVITVEPGIYIPESDTALAPAYRGFGVRIEDDVLVERDGATVLSAEIPKDIDEIERLMREKD
jgi:Xaa-Pro aminopeptidase